MDLAPTGSPIWLSHHWPGDHERCIRIGSTPVCRRCAVLYPLVVVAAVLTLVLDPPFVHVVAAMWLLPLPMSIEWVAEKLLGVRHSPARLTALSALAALGIGAALAAHVRRPFDMDALAPMATHVTLCAVPSILAARRAPVAPLVTDTSWEREHDLSEARRSVELRRLLSTSDRESLPTE